MKNKKKIKNYIYLLLLIVFLAVVAVRIFQNVVLINKISKTTQVGIEDILIEDSIVFARTSEGGGCSCGGWSPAGCGVSPCSATQMKQTRTCSPSGCDITYQCICDSSCGCVTPTNNAQYLAEYAPTQMYKSTTASAWVQMKNIGVATTWNSSFNYKLGSQHPQDNTYLVASGRVLLGGSDQIAPGQSKNFSFTITAPSTTGVYNFSWRMLREGVEWFGDTSPRIEINVIPNPYEGCVGGVPNGYCSETENQTMCGDCNTIVVMTPNTNLARGDTVTINLNFSDGRYLKDHNVSFALVIQPEGITWNSGNGCAYGGVIMNKDGSGGTMKWPSVSPDYTISNNYNFSTSFRCTIPDGVGTGVHTLFATPSFYSAPITLRATEIQFIVGGTTTTSMTSPSTTDFNSMLNSFINAIKSFLGIK